ncbi:MAG: M14 family metallopeptidase [Thermoanaerobaculia bacterium]
MKPLCLLCSAFTLSLILSGSAPALAGSAAERAILPPVQPWNGASRLLEAPASDPWRTPAEASSFRTTPSYDETVAYLHRLASASKKLSLVSLGKSSEGREIWMAVVTAGGDPSPASLAASGKPTLLAQAGIHAGEIDGKDAGLMLLRDLVVNGRKSALLDRTNFLFVPILNTDGHERVSPFGRVNQRGPERMGWRTTARNLNLNRDYAKLDSPEVWALVGAISRYQPDLYLDLHVTDGADYQYDITYGWNGTQAYSPTIAGWLDRVLGPAFDRDLKAAGHIPGPLVFLADEADPTQGNFHGVPQLRFSNGYGSARHLAAVLVENHSLKPYEQRVLGTYVLLESALRALGAEGAALREATASDRGRRPSSLPVTFKRAEGEAPKVPFLAIEARKEKSAISGEEKTVYTGKPLELSVPNIEINVPDQSVRRPRAYWVPATYPEVIDRLAAHGIRMERLDQPRRVKVEMYRLVDPKLDPDPFEGHMHLVAGTRTESREELYPAGSVRVPTDQPLGDLAALLLEPASADSFLQWGFFLEILQRTEYVEGYVIEPMAEAMLAEDPALAAEFQKKLSEDAAFAADPQARRRWFYERTPFADERYRLYPVGCEVAPAR